MKNTKKRLLAALLAGAMLTGLTACGGTSSDTAAEEETTQTDPSAETEGDAESDMGPAMQRIMESGTLVIGTASGYAPYEFIDINSVDQQVIGIDMALGKRIAEKLGVEVKISDMTFSALLGALTTDQIDIILGGMSPTEERKQSIDFSDVYLPAEQCIMIRKEDADTFTDLNAFDGVNVAVQKNTTQEALATDLMTGATVNSLEKIPVCVVELTSGRSDAVVIESTVAQQYLMANEDLMIANITFPEDRRYKDTAIGIAKGNEDLIAVINEVIAECLADGSIDQWISEYSEICVQNNQA